MTRYVQTFEKHSPGRLTVYRVGVCERGRPGLSMQQVFYGCKNKRRAEDYAAWLRHLLDLEATAKAAR